MSLSGSSSGQSLHLLGGPAPRVIERQFAWPMKHRQRVIHIAMHPHGGAYIVVSILIGRNLQAHAFKAHAVVVINFALVVLTQNIRQVAADEEYVG